MKRDRIRTPGARGAGRLTQCGTLIVLLAFLCACGGDEEPTGRPKTPRESHERMLAALDVVRRDVPDKNIYLGDAAARRCRKTLADLPADAPAARRFRVHFDLGVAEMKFGRDAEAIRQLELAVAVLPADAPATVRGEAHFTLGLANLRMGETQNCCLRARPESCILPLRDGAIHTRPEGSRRAIAEFTKAARAAPIESWLHLKSLWLLNLAAMTLDQHPAAVPEPYRLSFPVLTSGAPFPHFVNIAGKLGINTYNYAGGAIADDFDNDGHIDIVVTDSDPGAGQMRYFRNDGKGGFVDRTREAGLIGLLGGLNAVQADYDNDGFVDILVVRGAWNFHNGFHPNSLIRNNGDGTFTDVTFFAGLGEHHYPTQSAAWSDFDNDGDLDLYFGNEEVPGYNAPCQLFRNEGDGTFVEITEAAGVANHRHAKAVVWGDYDADRLPDLYVSNFKGPNRLYRNNGDGTFTDVAVKLGVEGPEYSFPSWFWDFDNDGHLDLFVSAYKITIADLAYSALGEKPMPGTLACLYRGDGQGGFTDVAASRDLVRPNAPMGANFGDLDNDGYLDMYLGTGWPDYEELMPGLMLINQKGERFVDVTANGGFGHLQKGHGVAFADFDGDGDQDVFEQMGGFYVGDRYYDALYENPGFGNHWLTVRLVGTTSNRFGIGARIRVDVVENGRPRSIFRHVNTGGTFGGNPLAQMVGLGKASRIERVEVYWPTTNRIQVLTDVEMDQRIEIVEEKPVK